MNHPAVYILHTRNDFRVQLVRKREDIFGDGHEPKAELIREVFGNCRTFTSHSRAINYALDFVKQNLPNGERWMQTLDAFDVVL